MRFAGPFVGRGFESCVGDIFEARACRIALCVIIGTVAILAQGTISAPMRFAGPFVGLVFDAFVLDGFVLDVHILSKI